MEVKITSREVGDRTVVAVSGELDVFTAPTFEARLSELVQGGRTRLVIDLSAVDFLDSTGLGVLVKALKWVRERDGTLAVVASEDRITKVFRITGLDVVMCLTSRLDEALGE